MQRAKTAKDIYQRQRKTIPLTGEWKEHLGEPEVRGSWFVHGASGHGKTSYLTLMSKMLMDFGKVCYNGLEEGDSWSFELALGRAGIPEDSNKFMMIEDNYGQLMERLNRRKSFDYLFIDSLQVMRINKDQYHELVKACEKKGVQLIINGHTEGKKPEGRLGKYIEYLSFIKIFVEGFQATPKSRYGGNRPYVIYEKRHAEYWQKVK